MQNVNDFPTCVVSTIYVITNDGGLSLRIYQTLNNYLNLDTEGLAGTLNDLESRQLPLKI